MLLHPPTPPPLPYTTLFRSKPATHGRGSRGSCHSTHPVTPSTPGRSPAAVPRGSAYPFHRRPATAHQTARNPAAERWRSEEHTSELQSRGHLVCRLLLEIKNRRDET